MVEYGVGYGLINYFVDCCKCCSYYGVIGNECLSCGNEDEVNIERICCIIGYFVGDMLKWNSVKCSEEIDWVKYKWKWWILFMIV